MNQEEHHSQESFKQEELAFLKSYEVDSKE